MAQTLNGEAGIGHNGHAEGIGTQEEYLDLLTRWEDAEGDLAAALANCREPRDRQKKIKKAIREKYGDEGWDAFERALKDAKRSSTSREREAQLHAAMLAWQRKPLNFQAVMDFAAPPPTFSATELDRIEDQGFVTGKTGDPAEINSHIPGSEAYARWHSGWVRGQSEKVVAEIAPKRGRGRPRKDGSPAQAKMTRGVKSTNGRGRRPKPDEAIEQAQRHLSGDTPTTEGEGGPAAEVL